MAGMYPPFRVPEVRTTTPEEINKTIRIINRAFEDLYRGSLYSISSMAKITQDLIAKGAVGTQQIAPQAVTVYNIASGLISSGLYQSSGVYQTSGVYAMSGSGATILETEVFR